MVWESLNRLNLPMLTVQGNLNGQQYIRDILNPVVLPHLDNNPLATRPIFMDDNARRHRCRAVTDLFQN